MRINWGVYAYHLGVVRVSFRGCMIIVDPSLIINNAKKALSLAL